MLIVKAESGEGPAKNTNGRPEFSDLDRCFVITHRRKREGSLRRLSLQDEDQWACMMRKDCYLCFAEQESMQMQHTRLRAEITGDIDRKKWKKCGPLTRVPSVPVLRCFFKLFSFFQFVFPYSGSGYPESSGRALFLTKLSTWRCLVTNWVETCWISR